MAAGNWKDWAQGEIVTEAGFQDIQDSIVFIYSNDSAANSALTNKVEGTSYYNTTDDELRIWDGSAWQSVGGAGKVLQVVTGETTTPTTSTSTTYSDTTLTASITPSATSSKILVLIAQEYNFYASVTTFIKAGIKVVRTIGATDTDIKETSGLTLNSATGSAAQFGGILAITILDSPSTTSSVTYKTQQHKEATDTSITTQSASEKSTITLIEIGE